MFLGKTASAMAVPCVFASLPDPAGGRNRFAFISDMHYAHVGEFAKAGTNWGLLEAGLVELVDYLSRQNLDFIMLGGDFCNIDAWFTDVAMLNDAHDAYQRVETEFARLGIPIYTLFGNHESFSARVDGKRDTTHEFYGEKLYRHHCGYGPEKATYYEFERNGWKFIALDSGRMIDSIEQPQMDWLNTVVQNIDKSMPIALFIHGPLYPFFGDAPSSTKLVTNYQEVIDLFKNHSLEIVYQGHMHKTKSVEISRVDDFGKRRATRFVLTGATFLVVNSPNHPDGDFNFIDTTGNRVEIQAIKALGQCG